MATATIYACANTAACQTGTSGDQSHEVVSNGNIGTPNQQSVGNSGGHLHSGFRFQGLPSNFKQGVVVNSATIELWCFSAGTGAPNGTLYGHDVQSPGTWNDASATFDVSGRTRTTASVAVGTGDWPTNTGNWAAFKSVTAIVQ